MKNTELNLIDIQIALERVDNDISLYKILINAFLEDSSFSPETMVKLVADTINGNGDTTEIASKYVHHMKGAAAQLGANILADKAQTLENVLRGKEQGDSKKLAEEVQLLYHNTCNELRKI